MLAEGRDLDRPLLIVRGLYRFIRLVERYANDLSHYFSRLLIRQEFPSVLEQRDKPVAMGFAPCGSRTPKEGETLLCIHPLDQHAGYWKRKCGGVVVAHDEFQGGLQISVFDHGPAEILRFEMARHVVFERNGRQQVRGYGRRDEPGMLQQKSAISPWNSPYVVQGLLESNARLAAIKRGLHPRNPQQGCCPHVRI